MLAFAWRPGTQALQVVPDAVVDRHFVRELGERVAVMRRSRQRVGFFPLLPGSLEDLLEAQSVSVAILRSRPRAPELEAAQRDLVLRSLVPGGLLVQTPGAAPPPELESVAGTAPGLFVRPRPADRDDVPVPNRQRPLSVPPCRSSSTLPPPPSRPEIRGFLDRAALLAEGGSIDDALQLVGLALRLDPNSPRAFLLRSQLSLASASIESALDDLRRLLFLAPACRLARYWYAVALGAARETERAVAQITELERHLQGADDDEVLEDERTTVAKLRHAAQVVRQSCAERVRLRQAAEIETIDPHDTISVEDGAPNG